MPDGHFLHQLRLASREMTRAAGGIERGLCEQGVGEVDVDIQLAAGARGLHAEGTGGEEAVAEGAGHQALGQQFERGVAGLAGQSGQIGADAVELSSLKTGTQAGADHIGEGVPIIGL